MSVVFKSTIDAKDCDITITNKNDKLSIFIGGPIEATGNLKIVAGEGRRNVTVFRKGVKGKNITIITGGDN